MSEIGYIKIPRSLLQDPLWKNLPPAYQSVFITILELVCYKPQKIDDHGHLIKIEPGQICISLRDLQKFCNKYISKNDIERSIKKLILYEFVRQEVRHRKSIITITHPVIYEYILKSSEPRSETNLRQTRDKLETQSKKERKKEGKNILEHIAQTDEKKSQEVAACASDDICYVANQTQPASPLRLKISEIYFSFDLKSFQNISDEDKSRWKEAYSSINIDQEILKMAEWCLSNPTKSKSKKQWRKFINNWLSRSNESEINKQAYRNRTASGFNGVDRRTKNQDGTPVENQYAELF